MIKPVGLILAIVLFLCSCSSGALRTEIINKDEEKQNDDAGFEQVVEDIENKVNNKGKVVQSDACFEQVVKAIQHKDKKALMSIFSKQALEQATDMDDSIEYVFALIDGDIKSWENEKWSSGDSTNNGNVVKTIRSWYTVTTDKDEYLFFMLEYVKDTGQPDNVGLYALRAIKAEDRKSQFGSWQDMAIAGIYKP